jgi:hypothetical protein
VIPFAVLVPVSVLCFGLVNRFIEGKMGLGLSLVFLFFNGGGVSEQNFFYIYIQIIYYYVIHQGRYDLRGLCCVYGRRNAISKFRNLGCNQVRTFFFFFSISTKKPCLQKTL